VLYRDWNNIVQECSCECHVGQEKPEVPPEINLTKESKRRVQGPYAKKRAKAEKAAAVSEAEPVEASPESSPPEDDAESTSLESL
jgi:hypothetical protein